MRYAALFVASICAGLVAMYIWIAVLTRSHEIEEVSLANTNLAAAVAQQIDGSISEVEHVLNALASEIEQTDFSQTKLEMLQPVLVGRVADIEQLKALSIYRSSGEWAVTSEAVASMRQNNSDREYFRFHANNTSRGAYVGLPIRSRSSGEWVLPVSKRINSADGAFCGVVVAALDLKYMSGLLGRYDIGAHGAITLSVSGRLLARVPSVAQNPGSSPSQSSLHSTFEQNRSGTGETLSPLDGLIRVVSFNHTRNYPILVTVSHGKQEALRGWRRVGYYVTFVVIFLCLLILVGGLLLIRSIGRRLVAELELRETKDALTAANQHLELLAQQDSLTGLANRRQFDERFLNAYRLARRHRRPLAVVMFDVDNFKTFNDLHGHVAGDYCLKLVAIALDAATKRPGDLVARYGGEEFVMMLPETDESGAFAVAEAARLRVSELEMSEFSLAGSKVSVSAGLAVLIIEKDEGVNALINRADIALYEAKRRGRNCVVNHSPCVT